MPNNLRPLEKGLRIIGYGPKVDDFVLGMNRAAEAAAPAARKISMDAITPMTIDDARGILSGGGTAATNYFKEKTTPQLNPFAKNQDLDISRYVVCKALDGLFYELGQEERKIRKDPAAQATNLLKQVFGR